MNNIEEAIKCYKEYIAIDPKLKHYGDATSRLNEIEDNIYSMIEWTNQRINYYHGIEALRDGKKLDSILVEINKSIEGSFSQYKSSGQLIKSKLNKLINLNKQINTTLDIENDSLKNTNEAKLDSLYFSVNKN